MKIKKTKKLIKELKPFVKYYQIISQKYHKELFDLEKDMEMVTGIKGIEFFFVDGECAGIGNSDRTMELIHLEDIK